MDSFFLAAAGLVVPGVLFGIHLRLKGSSSLFIIALAVGYFSSLPIGFLNRIFSSSGLLAWEVIALSVLAEEGMKGLALASVAKRKPVWTPELVTAAGALWSGFAFFELILRTSYGHSLWFFAWMPFFLHLTLGLLWGSLFLARRKVPALHPGSWAEPFVYHFGFNYCMSQEWWPAALGIIAAAGIRVYFLLRPQPPRFYS